MIAKCNLCPAKGFIGEKIQNASNAICKIVKGMFHVNNEKIMFL